MTHAMISSAARRGATILACITLGLAACTSTPVVPTGAAEARSELTRLQSDPSLAPLAQDALRDAEAAVQLAEQTGAEPAVATHRIYLAQRSVEIARAFAEARHADAERQALASQLDKARLDARTREVDTARNQAASARTDADSARQDTASAQAENLQLQREIDAMHARETDRGLVLTLGDVLFESGRSDLKSGSVSDLDQLASFLNKYPERSVLIEGHTDSVGSDDYNLGLSQRRAGSVRSYLVHQGIDVSRVSMQGMGESMPVGSNDSAGGRQQNRRVEIIVSNPPVAVSQR